MEETLYPIPVDSSKLTADGIFRKCCMLSCTNTSIRMREFANKSRICKMAACQDHLEELDNVHPQYCVICRKETEYQLTMDTLITDGEKQFKIIIEYKICRMQRECIKQLRRKMKGELTILCAHCRTPKGSEFKRCGGCFDAYYCNVECQRADWSKHKPYCMENRKT